MARIHHGATLTPHFRDFLPAWLAAQEWFLGAGGFVPVATWRLEDPAGEVGLETWLLRDDDTTVCVPLSYRGAPLEGLDDALIAEADHSVLGRRWIYDAARDPVYVDALWELANGLTEAEPGGKTGMAETRVTGLRPTPRPWTRLLVHRRLAPGSTPAEDSAGAVVVGWDDGASFVEACAAEFCS